jgi:exodeoxyribonuclease V alpha subunit
MSAVSHLAPLLARSDAAVSDRLRPYRELGVLGSLDVHVVDHLGMLVGESDPDVLLACALAVRAPRNGHVCVDLAQLSDEQLAIETDREPEEVAARPPPLPKDREAWIARVAKSPLVRIREELRAARPFVLDGSVLYTDRYLTYQERLAEAVRARLGVVTKPADASLLKSGIEALVRPAPDPAGRPLGGLDRQRLATAMALLRGLTVISGGPGTGKTYAVRVVLALLWAQWALANDPDAGTPGPRVALAAPTGKAAARMKEAIQHGINDFMRAAAGVLGQGRTPDQLRAFLDGLEPSTIHRLLGYDPLNPTRFRHDRANPLPHDVVVIDETSMVDLAMMAKLVDAVSGDARIVLLGDQRQLSSVEAGTVLADLCGPTGVEKVCISKAFARDLSAMAGMGTVAEHAEVRISRGPYDAIVELDRSRRFRPDSGIALFANECLAEDFRSERAVALLANRQDVCLLDHMALDSPNDGARKAIVDGYTPYLERLRNGPRPGETLDDVHRDVVGLFDGFRILCAHRRGRTGAASTNAAVTRLLASLQAIDPEDEYWIGRPILVTRNDYVVRLFNGDVGIVVNGAHGEKTVIFPAPGGLRAVPPARLPDHETVFAITIHKSQGSEFGHAMVVLPDRWSAVLTRELVYTGVTRAKARLTMVGKADVLAEALEHTVRRASGLRADIWGRDIRNRS